MKTFPNIVIGGLYYSMWVSNGFEFGKQYKVLDVLYPKKCDESNTIVFSEVVVELDGKPSRFFTDHFQRIFTQDAKVISDRVREIISREEKDLSKLTEKRDDLNGKIIEKYTTICKYKVLVIEPTEKETNKRKDIETVLFEFYSSMGMGKPDNHEEILDFVYNDVNGTADPIDWNESDVTISFRRFIESLTQS